jgi:hypothetical protein
MEKEFTPYELALELEQLGFDEPCFAYLKPNVLTYEITIGEFNEFEYHSAPTYSQAFRWFREKYSLDVTFRKMDYGPESQFTGYYFSIYKGNELIDIHGADKKGKLYEDSELECLKKLIEITKNK